MRIDHEKCFGVGNWACMEDVFQLFASYLKEWGIQGERSSFIPVVKFTYSCLEIVMCLRNTLVIGCHFLVVSLTLTWMRKLFKVASGSYSLLLPVH